MQKSNTNRNSASHDLQTIILALPSSEFSLARTCIYTHMRACREKERGEEGRALWKRLMLIEETNTSMSARVVYNGLTCVN